MGRKRAMSSRRSEPAGHLDLIGVPPNPPPLRFPGENEDNQSQLPVQQWCANKAMKIVYSPSFWLPSNSEVKETSAAVRQRYVDGKDQAPWEKYKSDIFRAHVDQGWEEPKNSPDLAYIHFDPPSGTMCCLEYKATFNWLDIIAYSDIRTSYAGKTSYAGESALICFDTYKKAVDSLGMPPRKKTVQKQASRQTTDMQGSHTPPPPSYQPNPNRAPPPPPRPSYQPNPNRAPPPPPRPPYQPNDGDGRGRNEGWGDVAKLLTEFFKP